MWIFLILYLFQIVSSIGDQIRVKDNYGVIHIVTKIINLRKKEKTTKRTSETFGEDLDLQTTNSNILAAAVDYVKYELQTKPHMKKDKVAIREAFVEIMNSPSQDLPNLIRAHIKQHKYHIDTKGPELKAADDGISDSVKKILNMIGNNYIIIILWNHINFIFFRWAQPVL